MCTTCRREPEIIPPMLTDEMIPAAIVADSVDACIVIMALDRFAHDYITVAGEIAADPRTTPYAQLVIMSNMTNITERTVQMIESIESCIAPVATENKGN